MPGTQKVVPIVSTAMMSLMTSFPKIREVK